MLNVSFLLGLIQAFFLEKLKIVKVIPIYEKYNLSFLENYRPISILPPITKFKNICICNQVNDYINSSNNNLFY